jgi:hypothetical protein
MHNSLTKRDNKSRIKLSKRENSSGGWDMAIADAKRQIARLELAIDTFTERKEAGEPWTGNQAATRSQDTT